MATRKEELLSAEVRNMKDKADLGLAVFTDGSFKGSKGISWLH